MSIQWRQSLPLQQSIGCISETLLGCFEGILTALRVGVNTSKAETEAASSEAAARSVNCIMN